MFSEIISTILEGLLLAGDFLWQAFWALMLGFMISGAIQAFVSKGGMVNYMGEEFDLRWRDVRPRVVSGERMDD